MRILAGILHQYFRDLKAEMRHFRPTWKPLVQMLGIMGTATLFSLLMNLFFARNGNISVIYTLAVMLVACVTPGYFYSAIASVLGVLGVNYFFMWPYLAFNFTQTGYPFTFALLFCTSFLTCSIMAAYRHQAERAQRSQRDTQALHTMTNQLLALREEETVTDVVSDWMERACGFPVQYFPQGQEPPATAFLLPVQVGGRAGGAFGVEDGGALAQRPQTAQLLRLFAAQWALVEENLLLARERNRAALEAETERLRSNLLRAISHDLRTPLTSISGAAGVLAESGETLRPQDRAQLSPGHSGQCPVADPHGGKPAVRYPDHPGSYRHTQGAGNGGRGIGRGCGPDSPAFSRPGPVCKSSGGAADGAHGRHAHRANPHQPDGKRPSIIAKAKRPSRWSYPKWARMRYSQYGITAKASRQND